MSGRLHNIIGRYANLLLIDTPFDPTEFKCVVMHTAQL